MRRLKQILLAIASILPVAAAAAPGPADVAALRTYVEKNRAYSPQARVAALRGVERLSAFFRDPVRFELEAAAIAALSDNGHSALLPPQWASRHPRSPVHLGLFADGLFTVAAPPAYAPSSPPPGRRDQRSAVADASGALIRAIRAASRLSATSS